MRLDRLHPARALLAAVLTLLCAPAAASALAPRVTVALFGDSVVEGYTIPNPVADSLAPQLADALGRDGFQPGGIGFVAANPTRWRFDHYALQPPTGTAPSVANPALGLPALSTSIPTGGWLMLGDGTEGGQDGLSGYGALAASPQATATLAVSDPEVAILYEGGANAAPFTVAGGARTWTITPPPAPGPTESWLAIPRGVRSLTVHGPSTGGLVFEGAIERLSRSPNKVQVEVEDLGHAGQPPWIGLTASTIAALRAQQFDISVFLDAYIPELSAVVPSDAASAIASYEQALTARARVARNARGWCVIADPSPMARVPASVTARFARVDRTIAARTGCAYTGVLGHAWPASSASNRGWTLLDGIHPSAKGYRRLAALLEPLIARLARERVASEG
ncbi:MAG TPA: hypothetical protein VHX88_11880 [Solirubrobacteraceae bacterium]|nr:hypothetical protein [Solirubrobacteraceae bacterium]